MESAQEWPDWLAWLPVEIRPGYPAEWAPELRVALWASLVVLSFTLWVWLFCMVSNRRRKVAKAARAAEKDSAVAHLYGDDAWAEAIRSDVLHDAPDTSTSETKSSESLEDIGSRFTVVYDQMVVSDSPELGSAPLGKLLEGQVVQALEIRTLPQQNRVRAKLKFLDRHGWISLRTVDGEFQWAVEGGELPDESYPSYWEHAESGNGHFDDVFSVVSADFAAVQDIFDDWARRHKSRRRLPTVVTRVERLESSHLWSRYAARRAWCTQGHPNEWLPRIRDYSEIFPGAPLNSSINETYLFHQCSVDDLNEIRADCILSKDYAITLSESPYGETGTTGSVDLSKCGAVEPVWRCSFASSPMDPPGERCLVIFRVALGASPRESGVSLCLDRPGLSRCFSTQVKALLYPEYFVTYDCAPEQAGDDACRGQNVGQRARWCYARSALQSFFGR